MIPVVLALAGSTMVTAGVVQGDRVRPVGVGPVAGWERASVAEQPFQVAALQRSVPVRLDIPRIGVHTPVMELGLNPDRTVAVPPLRGDAPAGWYRYLASPGEIGPAVILGHVDSARDGPGVFFRLGALRPGDTASVDRADGSTASFTVVGIVEYPKSAFPADAVYAPVDYPGLRLITCGGAFDAARGSYDANIVVYARLTGSRPPPLR